MAVNLRLGVLIFGYKLCEPLPGVQCIGGRREARAKQGERDSLIFLCSAFYTLRPNHLNAWKKLCPVEIHQCLFIVLRKKIPTSDLKSIPICQTKHGKRTPQELEVPMAKIIC